MIFVLFFFFSPRGWGFVNDRYIFCLNKKKNPMYDEMNTLGYNDLTMDQKLGFVDFLNTYFREAPHVQGGSLYRRNFVVKKTIDCTVVEYQYNFDPAFYAWMNYRVTLGELFTLPSFLKSRIAYILYLRGNRNLNRDSQAFKILEDQGFQRRRRNQHRRSRRRSRK